jgi:hypothetical protein
MNNWDNTILKGKSMTGKREKKSRDRSEHPDVNPDEKDQKAKQSGENPPRTTSKGWFTTPKFGSSTSGGGEMEPGPEKD